MASRYTITLTGTSDDLDGVTADTKALVALLRERSPSKRAPRVTILAQSQLDATVTDSDASAVLADVPARLTAASDAAAAREAAKRAEADRVAQEKADREAADQRDADVAETGKAGKP